MREIINSAFKEFCEKTKRSGGILVHSSISEWHDYLCKYLETKRQLLVRHFVNEDKEETFLSIIKDYVIKEDNDTYPNSIFYFNPHGQILFEWNTKKSHLYYDYYLVRRIFYERYRMDYNEVQSFIKDMAEKHFKIKDVRLNVSMMQTNNMIEKHFK